MSAKDVRTKYGGNTKMAIRRAIRAELTGGSRVLDELEYWSSQVNQHGQTSHAQTAYNAFCDIREEMVDAIRQTYTVGTADD